MAFEGCSTPLGHLSERVFAIAAPPSICRQSLLYPPKGCLSCGRLCFTQRLLRFHADRRSAKISELSAHPQITLHFYDASIKTQIRLEATAKLHVEDPLAAAAWEASWPVSRLCYAADIVPGVEVASPPAAPTAKDAEKNDGFGNFCLVIAAVHRLEWLHLAATGHQRAAFDWTGAECPSTRWLAP